MKSESDTARVTVPALGDAAANAEAATPSTPAPLPPTTESGGSGGGLRTAGLITAGAGVVALGVGTFLALDAKSSYDAAKKKCDGTTCGDAPFQESEDARSQGTIATVVFVVGGVALATGATLWLIAPSGSDETRPAAGLRVDRVGVGPGRVTLGGTF